jgi:hypothetical protein
MGSTGNYGGVSRPYFFLFAFKKDLIFGVTTYIIINEERETQNRKTRRQRKSEK